MLGGPQYWGIPPIWVFEAPNRTPSWVAGERSAGNVGRERSVWGLLHKISRMSSGKKEDTEGGRLGLRKSVQEVRSEPMLPGFKCKPPQGPQIGWTVTPSFGASGHVRCGLLVQAIVGAKSPWEPQCRLSSLGNVEHEHNDGKSRRTRWIDEYFQMRSLLCCCTLSEYDARLIDFFYSLVI